MKGKLHARFPGLWPRLFAGGEGCLYQGVDGVRVIRLRPCLPSSSTNSALPCLMSRNVQC